MNPAKRLAWLAPVAAILCAACSTRTPALHEASAVPGRPHSSSATLEAHVQEYFRKFPYQVTYDYTLRYTGGDPAKLNVWAVGNEPALVRAGQDVVPRTNNDTFIKGAALYLEDGPVVLESTAPARDRFNSFQLIDERNTNYRNIVHPVGKYTLYHGQKPSRLEGEPIEVPSRLSVVLVRVEVRDKSDERDVAAAKAVFNGLTIRGPKVATFPTVDVLRDFPGDVAAEAHRRMDEVFATVPLRLLVVGPGKEPGKDVSYLRHAAGSKGGWGGADPRHASFEAILVDKNGNEMHGDYGTYTLTTPEPPVDAFWSVTVYDTGRGGFLHRNRHDTHHINNTMVRRNSDGTVTFMFARACGAGDTNCLEVPAGRFEITARYYLPRREVRSGAWTMPRPELVGTRNTSAP